MARSTVKRDFEIAKLIGQEFGLLRAKLSLVFALNEIDQQIAATKKRLRKIDPKPDTKTPLQRFEAKVVKFPFDGTQYSDHWFWIGCLQSEGYGMLRIGGRKGRTVYAHRWSYEFFKGPIQAGCEPDHLCRVRHCANPDHLEPVTHRINCLRGEGFSAAHAMVTHCPKGHEYTPDNTIVGVQGYRNGHGPRRICRTCDTQRQREARNAHAETQ